MILSIKQYKGVLINMKITVTREMIDKAISSVDLKLAKGEQKKKLYSPTMKDEQYYINNILGEIGEIAFSEAVTGKGGRLGADSHSLDPFFNSDTCDFYTSKTAQTIDVKTIYKEGHSIDLNNLMITQSIALWRPIYAYVLVRLSPTIKTYHTLESIYEIDRADVLGSLTFQTINKKENLKEIYGRPVYVVNQSKLSPIYKLIRSQFYQKNETEDRYYSEDRVDLELASVEQGAVIKSESNNEIDEIARMYRGNNKDAGHYNFTPVFLYTSKKMISFSVYRGKLNSGLLLKALIEAEVKARRLKYTLVIPSYIEGFIPDKDLNKIIEVIDNLKCNVEYVWSHNKTY